MINWLLCAVLLSELFNIDKPAYRIFDKSGTEVSYEAMIDELSEANAVLFGEIHNNAIVHWLELQVAQDVYIQDSNLVLGLEMLEADNQLLLDEYLRGTIEKRHFEQEAKIWDNYSTDYQPLVTFAKEKNIPVIATNIPRRYASLVARGGIERLASLADQSKQWIAPLPIEIDTALSGYQNMLTMMGGTQAHSDRLHGGMNGERMVQAQAIKDATMAHFIQQNSEKGKTFLHINGTYHSDNFEGIYWYLNQQSSQLKIKTISCVEQEGLESLDTKNEGIADFVIVTPSDMTKTY